MSGYMGYVALALLLIAPVVYLLWLRGKRNAGTGRSAKKGGGYPSFNDGDAGNYHDGNDSGYQPPGGNSPK